MNRPLHFVNQMYHQNPCHLLLSLPYHYRQYLQSRSMSLLRPSLPCRQIPLTSHHLPLHYHYHLRRQSLPVLLELVQE
jgi:hypothetical protein